MNHPTPNITGRRVGERLYWPGGNVTRLCGAAV